MKILIMAGGNGERFWPISTKERPKQLLPLLSDKTMIRETIDRLDGLVTARDIYISTNTIQFENIRKELHEIPEDNIIIEPAFRDTAAAILYGSTYIASRFDNPVIVVLASDHAISNVAEFKKAIIKAHHIASETNKIVTLGIKPTYPEVGYGYIKINNPQILSINENVQFVEKPTLEKAKTFIEDEIYLWNSGMFIFKYKSIINEFKKHAPNFLKVIDSISDKMHQHHGLVLANLINIPFQTFPKISIDFAIIEKSNNLICLPTDFGWNDVGSFYGLFLFKQKDGANNSFGSLNVKYIESSNNFFISDSDKINVFMLNVNNMLIIYHESKLVILPLDKSHLIKELKKLSNT
jgi:mannose-1-phosphate guanylyltransferase